MCDFRLGFAYFALSRGVAGPYSRPAREAPGVRREFRRVTGRGIPGG